jgi:DNA polymerase-3 subunit delta'
MQFSQIIGQHDTKQYLTTSVQQGHLPHAQLWLSPQGSGSLALALAYIQYVLCLHPTPHDSCGTCQHCRKISKRIHPDLHFSYPVIKKEKKGISTDYLAEWRKALQNNPYLPYQQWLKTIDAENKQGNISKDECADILHKLSLKSFESPYKVLIMWLPEYLGTEGNRLLKLLEEPPEDTLFVLVAESQEAILPTIRSRCQLLKIPKLHDTDLIQYLQTQLPHLPLEQAATAAFLADGDANAALDFAQNTENNLFDIFIEWLRTCYVGKGPDMLRWTEKVALQGRENQKHLFQYGLHFVRSWMLLRVTQDTSRVKLQPRELQAAVNLANKVQAPFDQLTNLLNETIAHIERNANPKILFLDASIQLSKMLRPIVG